jgi:hypothetical protein
MFNLGCMADIIAKACAGGKIDVANTPAETGAETEGWAPGTLDPGARSLGR